MTKSKETNHGADLTGLVSHARSVLRLICDKQSLEVRKGLECAAILHRFDMQSLNVLCSWRDLQMDRDCFDAITRLPFVEFNGSRSEWSIKTIFRTALRQGLFEEDHVGFTHLSKIAANVSADNGNLAERAYHMLWAEGNFRPSDATELISKLKIDQTESKSCEIRLQELLDVEKFASPSVMGWSEWFLIQLRENALPPAEMITRIKDVVDADTFPDESECGLHGSFSELLGWKSLNVRDLESANSAFERATFFYKTLIFDKKDDPIWLEQRISMMHQAFSARPKPDFLRLATTSLNLPNQIFISAVTSEFESPDSSNPGLRGRLRYYLARAECHVVVQEELRQTGEPLLEKLDYFIRQCGALVQLIGVEWGSKPSRDEVNRFLRTSPDFLENGPQLRDAFGDFLDLTYTQWEGLLAVHHCVDFRGYDFSPNSSNDNSYRKCLKLAGKYFEVVEDVEDLLGKMLGDLREIIPGLPHLMGAQIARDAIQSQNDRFLDKTNLELINHQPLVRTETDQVIAALVEKDKPAVLLVADAGFGKSCVLAQVTQKLIDDHWPVLAFKMDSLPECTTAASVGNELDLPSNPVDSLGRVAGSAPCVLIVDQLDAISTVSGRKTNSWDAFDEIRRLATRWPNMRLVVACRKFDLEQDHRLRTLTGKHSEFTTINIGKLTEAQVQQELDTAGLSNIFKPTAKQREILALPLHLTLFLQGDPSRPFSTIGQLYDTYWERKQDKIRETLGRPPRWIVIFERLTTWMSERQSLTAPEDHFDDHRDDVREMISEHVLTKTGNALQFFHESFFDYAFARMFCRQEQTIVEFLTRPGEEQQLFRRAQVRQILGYRRETRFDEYLRDLRELLQSENVRFHLRRMVASELKRIEHPRPEELAVVRTHILDGELSRYVSVAMRSSIGWFDVMDNCRVLDEWLMSGSEPLCNAAIWFMESKELHPSRSTRIAELLKQYSDLSDFWVKQLKRMFSWGIAYRSGMKELFLRLFNAGAYEGAMPGDADRGLWDVLYDAKNECPQFVIDVFAIWLRRSFEKHDDGSWKVFDKDPLNRSNAGGNLVATVSASEPEYYIRTILPILTDIVCQTEVWQMDRLVNRAWPYLTNWGTAFNVDRTVLLAICDQLQVIAKTNPALFRELIEPIKDKPHDTFAYLILESYSANPEEFADECIEYILNQKTRLNVGYGSWSGSEGSGESAITRRAIQRVSPHCREDLLRAIEDAVIEYCDEYERLDYKRRNFGEYLVLHAIEPAKRSDRVKVRLSELECKFRGVSTEIPEVKRSSVLSRVGPPIAPEKSALMTDEQWISAMLKYDGSTDRFEGGPVELSRELNRCTVEDRQRFAKLTLKMLDQIHSYYFSAILEGMCGDRGNLNDEQKRLDAEQAASVPTDLFVAVINRLHQLPNRPCGSAIAHCLRKLEDRDWPAEVLETIGWYAVNDPDPTEDLWTESSERTQYYGGEPFTQGINCVRGQAAEAIANLIWHDNQRLAMFQTAIGSLVADPVLAVRTCAVNVLNDMYSMEPEQAVRLFQECVGTNLDLIVTPPVQRFIHRVIQRDYMRLKDILTNALESGDEEAVEMAASHIILYDLGLNQDEELAERIRSGTPTMRKAACEVYAQNIGHAEVGHRSFQYLTRYFDDDDPEVREQVSRAFWRVSGEQLFELEKSLIDYIDSLAFVENPEALLHALEESRAKLPYVILQAADRILMTGGEEGGNISIAGARYAHSISTLVVRQYAQTDDSQIKLQCLNLIDRMERHGDYGLQEELEKLDR